MNSWVKYLLAALLAGMAAGAVHGWEFVQNTDPIGDTTQYVQQAQDGVVLIVECNPAGKVDGNYLPARSKWQLWLRGDSNFAYDEMKGESAPFAYWRFRFDDRKAEEYIWGILPEHQHVAKMLSFRYWPDGKEFGDDIIDWMMLSIMNSGFFQQMIESESITIEVKFQEGDTRFPKFDLTGFAEAASECPY